MYLYAGLGRPAELSLDSQVPFLGLERSSFHPVVQSAPLGAALVGQGWSGCWNVQLCSVWHLVPSPACPQTVTDGTCQVSGDTNQPGWIFSGKHMARPFCWCGSPSAFLCSHQMHHLLWCPSLALFHPRWCWQCHTVPQELQFYRTLMMPWQYKIPHQLT